MKTSILFSLFLSSLLFLSFSINNGDRLNNGDIAPKFKVQDVRGDELKLQQLIKQNPKTLLVFLRHAWCPICNVRSHDLINRFDELKNAGYNVVVVYQSKKERLEEFAADHQLPYHVISDPTGELYQLYKVEHNMQRVKSDYEGNEQTKSLFAKGSKLFKKEMKAYMDEEDGVSDLIPADFVIDEKGKIEKAHYGKFFGDHLSLDELLVKNTTPSKAEDKKTYEHTRF